MKNNKPLRDPKELYKNSIIVSYLYVSKNLKNNPAKAIKYILINRSLFSSITDEMIFQIKKERSITDEDISNVVVDKFI